MTAKSAQLVLVSFALFALVLVLLVFVTGRLWGFPLDYTLQEEVPLVQLLAPPLFGVLGGAANYLAAPATVTIDRRHRPLMTLMILAPTLIFLFLFITVTAVFHFSNVSDSGTSFSIEAYRFWLTTILSFFTLTIPVISATLFKRAQ